MNSGLRYSALAAAVLAAIYFGPVRSVAQAPVAPAPATTLPWAYPLSPPAVPNPNPPPPDPTVLHVPNSTAGFTRAQIGDGFNPPDWHPDGHPAMPNLVAHGRREDVRACGFCHLPNAQGRPENASLAGLPAAYIRAQVADYRNGLRKSSEPNMGPPANMLKLAKASNEEEIIPAAEYFSKLTYKPNWITVKEAKMVPKTWWPWAGCWWWKVKRWNRSGCASWKLRRIWKTPRSATLLHRSLPTFRQAPSRRVRRW